MLCLLGFNFLKYSKRCYHALIKGTTANTSLHEIVIEGDLYNTRIFGASGEKLSLQILRWVQNSSIGTISNSLLVLCASKYFVTN